MKILLSSTRDTLTFFPLWKTKGLKEYTLQIKGPKGGFRTDAIKEPFLVP